MLGNKKGDMLAPAPRGLLVSAAHRPEGCPAVPHPSRASLAAPARSPGLRCATRAAAHASTHLPSIPLVLRNSRWPEERRVISAPPTRPAPEAGWVAAVPSPAGRLRTGARSRAAAVDTAAAAGGAHPRLRPGRPSRRHRLSAARSTRRRRRPADPQAAVRAAGPDCCPYPTAWVAADAPCLLRPSLAAAACTPGGAGWLVGRTAVVV